ncbi:MAG: hypothetical protein ACKVP2_13595 [Burkholderiales bacterium]
MRRLVVSFLLFLSLASAARAGCQEQLRLLADDLMNVKLTESQKANLAGVILDAKRYCWVQQDKPAMQHITRARQIAGIRPPTDEMDWENVPLESLEPKN